MRRTTVRRTAVAASALSLALLVGACGADKSADDAPESKGKNEGAAAAKPLSQAELDKLVLAEGDVKNHKVVKPLKADLAAAKIAKADKAECKPLVDATAMRTLGSPAANSMRRISVMPEKPAEDASPEEKLKAGLDAVGKAVIITDTLGSYEGEGAQEALAALRDAGKACAGGFTTIAGPDKVTYSKVAPASYTAGDEAVAFTLTADLDGETGTAQLVTVRTGNTLASFFAMSLMGKAEQPKEAIDAQLAKLG
ncbi:hypothetical protein [Streptomyces chryseus]|uniref:Lipoprotein n=1 Tax=Streptomyces chryseus TaxID=68186 RepID=A0ABQ3E157_9ACTN|nr:hypothetical protein [Streptomyces chryseus]GGX39598.1 lipoprotein [Streptomyces chryseus]GHB21525.1 lipoprotein [Streptomyces chryseus]